MKRGKREKRERNERERKERDEVRDEMRGRDEKKKKRERTSFSVPCDPPRKTFFENFDIEIFLFLLLSFVAESE